MDAFRIPDRIRARIAELSKIALEEAEEGQLPLSDDSRRGLFDFLRDLAARGLNMIPSLTLTYEGNIKAKWRRSPDERLALEFLGRDRLRFMFFRPDPDSPGKTLRTSGEETASRFFDDRPDAMRFLRAFASRAPVPPDGRNGKNDFPDRSVSPKTPRTSAAGESGSETR